VSAISDVTSSRRDAGPTLSTLWALRAPRRDMTATEANVLTNMLKFMGRDGIASASLAQLERASLLTEKTIVRAIDRLLAFGALVEVRPRTRAMTGAYEVNIEAATADVQSRPPKETGFRVTQTIRQGAGFTRHGAGLDEPSSEDRIRHWRPLQSGTDAKANPALTPKQSGTVPPSEDLLRIPDEDLEDQIPQTPFFGRDQDPPTTPSQGIRPKVIADDNVLRAWTAIENLDAFPDTNKPLDVVNDELRDMGIDPDALAERGRAFIASLRQAPTEPSASPPAFVQATLLDLGTTQEAPAPSKARKTPPKVKAEKPPKPPKVDKPPKVKKSKDECCEARYLDAFSRGMANALGHPFKIPLEGRIKLDLVALATGFALNEDKTKKTGDDLLTWFEERAEAFRRADAPKALHYGSNGGYTPKGMLWWLNNGCEGEQVIRQKYVAPKPYVHPPWPEQLETMMRKQPDEPDTWIIFQEMVNIEKRVGFPVSFVAPADGILFNWWRKQTAGDKAEDARPELRERLDKLLDAGKIVRRVEVAE